MMTWGDMRLSPQVVVHNRLDRKEKCKVVRSSSKGGPGTAVIFPFPLPMAPVTRS